MAVRAEIEFLAPGSERPFTYARETPSGAEPETARFVSHAVEIRDLRGGEVLRLDEHGGTLGRWPTRVRRFGEDDYLRERYYPESAEIIQAALGANRVIVFDHNVRRGGSSGPRADGHAVGRPVHHAHTDYTPRSALDRLRHELGRCSARRRAALPGAHRRDLLPHARARAALVLRLEYDGR